MRIDETLGAAAHAGSIQRGQAGSQADGSRSAQGQPAGAQFGTQVEVSDQGRAIARARQIAASTHDNRAVRVAELRAQIEAGTYRVDSRALARAILEELSGANA